MLFFFFQYWELLVQVNPYDMSEYCPTNHTFPGVRAMDINDFMLDQAQVGSSCGPYVAIGLFAERLVSICNYAKFCMWTFLCIEKEQPKQVFLLELKNTRKRGMLAVPGQGGKIIFKAKDPGRR